MPKTFLMLVLAVGILLFAKEFFQNRKTQSKGKSTELPAFPFQRRAALFSPAERNLWRKLTQAAGEDSLVLGKVRLADLVGVHPDLKPAEAKIFQDQIKSAALDFAVCHRSHFGVAAAVLLDRDKRQKKIRENPDSDLIQGALAAAGVPLLRLSPEKNYTTNTLRTELRRAVSAAAAADRATNNRQAPTVGHGLPSASSPETCPTCSAKLVKRRVSGGRMDGKQVLACPNYPACKHVLPLSIQTVASG